MEKEKKLQYAQEIKTYLEGRELSRSEIRKVLSTCYNIVRKEMEKEKLKDVSNIKTRDELDDVKKMV